MSRKAKLGLLIGAFIAYVITGILVIIFKEPDYIGLIFYATVGLFFGNYVLKETKASKSGNVIEDEMSENQRNKAGLRALIQSYYLWFIISQFYEIDPTPLTIGLLGMFLLFVGNHFWIKKVL